MSTRLICTAIFIGSAMCGGCVQHHASFQEFSSGIPTLDLPVEFTCSSGPEQVDYSALDTFWLNRLVSTGRNYIVGKIFSESLYVALLFRKVGDQNFPWISTFALDGTPIDSKEITGDCFDAPDGTVLKYKTVVNSDHTITVTDSTRMFDIDSAGNIIEASEQLRLKVSHYSISREGKILSRHQ